MVDRSRGGDVQAAILGAAQNLKCICARDRSRVITTADKGNQPYVTLEHHRFRSLRNAEQAEARGEFTFVHHAIADQVWVFGVMNDHRIEIAGVGQRAPHDLCVGYAFRTVGEGDRACRLEQADLRHFLALELFRDGRHRMHMHYGVVACAAQDVVDRRGIVDGGRRVGLANDGGDAAGSRGLARGGEGFAVGLAGLADEGAHVDEPRSHQFSPAVDHIGAFRHACGADPFLGLADGAFCHQQVADNIEVARRIDDPGIGEQDRAAVGQHHVTRSVNSATALQAPPCARRRPSRPVRGSAIAGRQRR